METSDFINRLPKAELHLHLEGAVPWDMIREYATENLPEQAIWHASDFRYDDFAQFSHAINLSNRYVFRTPERYHQAAKRVFAEVAAQNGRYVEVSFAAEHVHGLGLSIAEVAQAVSDAAPETLTVAIFCGFDRMLPPDNAIVKAVFDAPAVDGIDLHAVEVVGSAPPYAEIYRAARERGLMTKAHAGEQAGAASVWEVIHHLGVKRIEHGTCAIEDPALIEYLVREDITLDLCPTSNVKLRVVDDLASHPIKSFFKSGIAVTVSTDDPTYFGCSLNEELANLVNEIGFSLPELAQIQKNAFRVAKMSEDERAVVSAEIDSLINQLH